MREFNNDLNISQTVELMTSYSFDLHGNATEALIEQWLSNYHGNWIRLAVIEALYLGRYKAISIEQILEVWSRLGNPNPHFSHEFERLICRKLPKHFTSYAEDFSTNISIKKTTTALERENIKVSESESFPEPTETVDKIENTREDKSEKDKTAADNASEPEEEERQSNFSAASALGLHYQSSRSRHKSDREAIHEFTPLPDVSAFYNKLKSLAEEKPEEE